MKFHTLKDIELWKLVADGDQTAFDHIYLTHAKDLYKYGFRFTQDTELIKDVIQDVFIHIWESKNVLFINKSIKFYLFSCFRREVIKRVNVACKYESIEDYHSKISWEVSFQEILEENQISLDSTHKLSRAIDALPLRQKEAIYLRYLQELTYDEISELMGVQIPSIYNLIFKGIKSLKTVLSHSDFTSKVIFLFFFNLHWY
ncbi:RNA polymerase sigma factor [Cyclobacterium plantarum]|uniref:Sigma-70 family RNA polymerase sigma factor n=2 Tax=Cyclobacterium plantarum TaxID=2716263 RepID=A0ABX0HGY0_9BACT|nr:sigma-70 family RNA polymerase sigma factor [Cyclobacterium plantarum]NHE59568.1 sigma-70 family RNA polymerase sigma factor [Cyclobacterium plantarum]